VDGKAFKDDNTFAGLTIESTIEDTEPISSKHDDV
jgi:hypothetical protein